MSDYTPQVGRRARFVVEAFILKTPSEDAGSIWALTDERGGPPAFYLPPSLVVSVERLPDPEPEWQPGDVVLDAEGWYFTRRAPQHERFSAYPWTEGAQRDLLNGDWANDRQVVRPVTLLVRNGEPRVAE